METYEMIQMEIVEFGEEDVITASGMPNIQQGPNETDLDNFYNK